MSLSVHSDQKIFVTKNQLSATNVKFGVNTLRMHSVAWSMMEMGAIK